MCLTDVSEHPSCSQQLRGIPPACQLGHTSCYRVGGAAGPSPPHAPRAFRLLSLSREKAFCLQVRPSSLPFPLISPGASSWSRATCL